MKKLITTLFIITLLLTACTSSEEKEINSLSQNLYNSISNLEKSYEITSEQPEIKMIITYDKQTNLSEVYYEYLTDYYGVRSVRLEVNPTLNQINSAIMTDLDGNENDVFLKMGNVNDALGFDTYDNFIKSLLNDTTGEKYNNISSTDTTYSYEINDSKLELNKNGNELIKTSTNKNGLEETTTFILK